MQQSALYLGQNGTLLQLKDKMFFSVSIVCMSQMWVHVFFFGCVPVVACVYTICYVSACCISVYTGMDVHLRVKAKCTLKKMRAAVRIRSWEMTPNQANVQIQSHSYEA